jgi:hypothetical protein
MSAEATALETRVEHVVRRRLPDGVRLVTVEPSEGEDGDEYLLVTVHLSSHDVDDEELERLLEEIESSVATLDQRYPSVRFVDAA